MIEARQLIGQVSTVAHALREADVAQHLQHRAKTALLWAERQLGVAAAAERVLVRPADIAAHRWMAAQRFGKASVQQFDSAVQKCTPRHLNRVSVMRVLDGEEPERRANPAHREPQDHVNELMRLVAWAASIAEDELEEDEVADPLDFTTVSAANRRGLALDLDILLQIHVRLERQADDARILREERRNA